MKTNSAKFIKRSRVLLFFTLLVIIIFQLTFTVQPVTGDGENGPNGINGVVPSFSDYYWDPPRVVTVGSADITSTTAIVTGNLTALGTAEGWRFTNVEAFFKYGKTWNATIYPSWAGGITTPGQVMKEAGMFSVNVSDLEPGTTYYFRAVAKGEGTFLGNCMTFVTSAGAE